MVNIFDQSEHGVLKQSKTRNALLLHQGHATYSSWASNNQQSLSLKAREAYFHTKAVKHCHPMASTDWMNVDLVALFSVIFLNSLFYILCLIPFSFIRCYLYLQPPALYNTSVFLIYITYSETLSTIVHYSNLEPLYNLSVVLALKKTSQRSLAF